MPAKRADQDIGSRTGDRERVRECIDLLEGVYGLPKRRGLGPVDQLVQTILSQNTTSPNTHRAFENLKRRFPDYQALLDAPDQEVSPLIRCGGLANIKTRRIKETLEKIREIGDEREIGEGRVSGEERETGEERVSGEEMGMKGGIERARKAGFINLDFLKGMDPEEARDLLVSLPGVGPKTAAVVLLFSFNMPFLPVDTHVNRLSRRLGLVPEGASIDEAERILEKITPRDKYCSFHVNLIRHGRAICRARSPSCKECVMREICPSRDLVGQKG